MKYTITDSHSLCATVDFTEEIQQATKLRVTKGEKSVLVNINPKQGSARQRFTLKGQGQELFALLTGAKKASPVEVDVEVAE